MDFSDCDWFCLCVHFFLATFKASLFLKIPLQKIHCLSTIPYCNGRMRGAQKIHLEAPSHIHINSLRPAVIKPLSSVGHSLCKVQLFFLCHVISLSIFNFLKVHYVHFLFLD